MRAYGAPIDTDLVTVLTEEVQQTAGRVAWLSALVAELQHDGDGYSESIDDDGKRTLRLKTGLKQMDTSGKFEKPSVWVEMYQTERQHLARVCKMAIDIGVAERQMQAIERQAEEWIAIIRGVLNHPLLALTRSSKQWRRRFCASSSHASRAVQRHALPLGYRPRTRRSVLACSSTCGMPTRSTSTSASDSIATST